MKRKITINKNNDKIISGRLNIPAKLMEEMGITEEDREVNISLEGNKLIIEKAVNNDKNQSFEKIHIEITPEEREYLF